MFTVYRKRKNSPIARWHFNTQCMRWPETDFIQVRVVEGEPLCQECVRLEAEMFPERKEYRSEARRKQHSQQAGEVMELRHHPLISHRGLRSWPPVWSPANPRGALKPMVGEIGRLKYLLPNTLSDRCFLVIAHEHHAYVGCLLIDDRAFCAQITKILRDQIGRTVREIGDLDLFRTL